MGSVDEKHLDVKPDNANRSDEQFDDLLRLNQAGEISELVVVAEGEERTTFFVWLLVACSSISGLLFGKLVIFLLCFESHMLKLGIAGYDTGVISGALVTIGSDLGPAELSSGNKVLALQMFCSYIDSVSRNSSPLPPHLAPYSED